MGFKHFKGLVHFLKKILLKNYSPPCHPRCPCHSFFSRKEIWPSWTNAT